jgi:hypothetical protein
MLEILWLSTKQEATGQQVRQWVALGWQRWSHWLLQLRAWQEAALQVAPRLLQALVRQ